jgi:hypothetical protein
MDNDFISEAENSTKKISIQGTNNRYQVKKLINPHKETKKRVESEKWSFSPEYYAYEKQLTILRFIYKNNTNNKNDINKNDINNNIITEDEQNIVKIMTQQIQKKIASYKQQDLLKKHFSEEHFLTFENVVKKLVDCNLHCYYCQKEMAILYDISREMLQWSVDRIDNDKGHNIDNYHVSCLECNLKRRRRTDEKFRFTKQLQLVKQSLKCKI